MSTGKKTAVLVGVLFIIGTLAGILSVVVTGPVLKDSDYLTIVAANETRIVIGSLLVLIMGFALAMVPVILYPVFKKYNEVLALGAVVFRGVLEAVSYIATVICWMLLLMLSREFVKAGAPDAPYFQTMGIMLLGAVDRIGQILSIVFSLGALMIYYIFYKSKLIPRWLSLWGILGAVLYLAVPLAGMFGLVWEILYAPLAVQELVLALWLIIRGFNSAA